MKIYIAHNFEARFWLRGLIEKGEFEGFEVTSRWITECLKETSETGIEEAAKDVEDIKKADVLVLFVKPFGLKTGRGKWFEFGLAVGLNKDVILVGEDNSCVFVWLKTCRRVRDLGELKELLGRMKVEA